MEEPNMDAGAPPDHVGDVSHRATRGDRPVHGDKDSFAVVHRTLLSAKVFQMNSLWGLGNDFGS
jgi:hypothetical protein